MRGEDLLQALDDLPEDILNKNIKPPRRRLWIPALAACLALVIGLGALLWPRTPDTTLSIPRLDPANSLNGLGFRAEGQEPEAGGKVSVIAPQGYFHKCTVVVVRAVEALPDVYEDMPAYAPGQIRRWRIFRLEIVDALDSGLTGDLLYAIPEAYYQDLTAWDTLLLSIAQNLLDYTLKNTTDGSLLTLESLYVDGSPYHGEIVAFRNGVFDESLWSKGLWADPPYFPFSAYQELDREGNCLIVRRGSTLEEALAVIEARRAESDHRVPLVNLSVQALAAAESMEEAFVGTGYKWDPAYQHRYLGYTRYIGGCPTNEYATIDPQTGEVCYSEVRFTPEDLEALPDLSAYMDTLDLSSLELPYDADRGALLYRAVYGWYEKTETGVRAFVKVTWYHESSEALVVYDDLFLEVTLEGVQVRSRMEMRDILGQENENLPHFITKEGPVHLMWKY